MKQLFIFIAGMIAGALLLYGIGFRSETAVREKIRQQLIEAVSKNFPNENQEASVQYVEIKGKKGTVRLHTGMPKDSVQLLVGKPDEINLSKVGGTNYEKWGYKLKNHYISDLDIDFENGKLEGVRQN